jgi:hypothetical protein
MAQLMFTPDPVYARVRALGTLVALVAVFAGIEFTAREVSAQGTIAFVQVNSTTPQSSVTTAPVRFTGAQTAGNLNVVVVGWNNTTGQVQSVVDTAGNTYRRAVGPTVWSGAATQSIYYAANIAAASANTNTVTVSFSPAAQHADIRIAEYSGIATVNPLDVTAAAQGSGTSSSSGSVTTTNANDLLVGANIVQKVTSGPGTSFTRRIITSPDGDILEDRIVTATGSYNATAPVSSGWWIMQMVAFRAAGSAGGDTQLPTAPGTPVLNVVSSTQINMTWSAATDNVGVTGYRVERCSGASCSNFAQVGTPSAASFSDTGLTASTTYRYRIRATDAANNLGPYSGIATATTLAPADTQPPTAPGTPAPSVVSSTQINLTWPAATDNVGVTGYRVERCSGSGCGNFAQIGTPTAASFNDTGLNAATSYSYRVRAIDAATNLSGYSVVASATTLAAPDTQPPTAPGTPAPGVVSSTQINLTWPAATDDVGVTGYRVERCSGAGCGNFAQIGTPTAASFNDAGLTASTSYSYRVRATDAATNLGGYSVVASATTFAAPDTQPPTAPGTPVLTVVSSSQINITWPAASDDVGVTAYRLERCAGASCSLFTQVATPATTSFNDTGLSQSTSYSYRVRATDAATNVGAYSVVASAATWAASGDAQPPTAPGTPVPTVISSNRIDLNWPAATDNVGVTGYRVELCQGAGCTNFVEVGTVNSSAASGPLTASANPNYFKTPAGTPIILNGSQTWNTLQDWGSNGVVQTLDFPAFVNFLVAHGHNFTMLWHMELPRFCGLPTASTSPPDFTVSPQPWLRTGPGNATDGKPKFDLTRFDQNYFDRVRTRVQALYDSGIYTGVYLFSGEWVDAFRCANDGYPYTGANNINGVNDGGSTGSITMSAPNAITDFQDAYVEKLVDTLNDLPNVLWIVSEEAGSNTNWWNAHHIAHLRSYESGKPARHPIGYGTPDLTDAALTNSDADWIAPGARISPTTSCGTGTPPCKVNINDSDHSYFGMWNGSAQDNRNYAWENFANGNQVVFMDPYVVYYPREGRNLCGSPNNAICAAPDARWDNFRDNLGYILRYANKLNLENVTPRGSSCSSTGSCLAQTPSVGAEYLIYASNGGPFTVNLSAMSSGRSVIVEWFDPSRGTTTIAGSVPAGSSSRSFTPPFNGDAVLYLADSAGHAGSSGAGPGTSYTLNGLSASTTYSFRVRAIDSSDNLGPYSASANATTQPSADTQPPTAPGAAVPTVVSTSQINLTWPAATDDVGVVGYRVERCASPGCTDFAQVGTPATTSFNDTGLTASTTYTYRIRGTDAANNLGPYSQTASATTPAAGDTQPPTAPGTPVLTVVSSSQINLTWPAASDNVGVTGYRIERCAGAGCTTFAQIAAPATTSFNDTALPASTSHTYRVRGTDAANNLGPYSATASATTPAPAPITLVQHTSKDAGTTTSSPLAFAANTTAGNWIGVAIRAGQTGQTFTVTDNRGNVYRKAVQLNETTDVTTLAIYYAENITGGATTVTVADTLSGGTLRFAILEYAGIAQTSSFDAAAAAQGSSSSPSSGAATTTAAGDLVIAVLSSANARTFTAGTGWTIQDRVPAAPNTKLAVEDQIKTTAGQATATATLSSSDIWGAAVAAFRAAASGPPPPADLTLTDTHVGNFGQGQTGAAYTLTVRNVGAGVSSGLVTVTDTLPGELTATGIAGTNWTCGQPAGPCTRTDALAAGASYPTITLTVNVAGNAPASVVNTASVNGGGETNTANNTATDVTTIAAPDAEPPSVPGLVTAVAPNGTHVDLSWGTSTDNVGVTNYRVERCDGVCTDVGFVKIAAPIGTTFSDSGLSTNTTYSYIVRAEDAASNLGPYSNVATVTTLSTIPELVAAYAFDEGTGTTVADLSGNGRTGTIVSAVWSTSGKYGKALSFNGTNARVSIPDAAALHLTTGMTLEAWINPSTVSSAWRDVIYKGNDNYYLMATTSPNGSPAAGGTFAGTNTNLLGTSALPVNTWTHLAATYDGAMLRLYVNGAPVSMVARTGALSSSTNPLGIGGDSIFGQYFSGLIDEVRVYNIALPPSQIQADMFAPLGAAIPVVTFSPSSIDFGSLATGSSSIQGVTITNTGTAPLIVSGISVTGPNPGDFSQTSNCGASLAPHTACTASITFSPVTTGARTAALSVADNASGTPHTVALTGTGTGFSITPRVSVLTPALSQQFSTNGASTDTPMWSVDGVEGGSPTAGTITPTGLYTPPATQGIHTISYTDSAHTSSASAYVTSYPGVFTHHNDNLRTGQNLGEIVLTPSNVNSGTFGKLFSFGLDGLSMASPLYVAGVNIPGQGVHNVVYVATQHDSVYAFDADGLSAAPLWQKSFLSAGVTTVPASDTSECCDIAPEIGITGTPVIDSATGTLYVVAKTKEGTVYRQRLHALDISTGTERFGGPILIQASVPGNGQGSSGGLVPFDALRENQRPALLLNNGVVYIAFGSHGDIQPYHGWVLGYNATTLQQTMAVNVSPNAEGGGIWQANGGPAADSTGNIFVVTGNGTFDTNSTNRKNYGDSILKISPAGTIADFFTPHDQAAMNSNNFDLGAAGAMLLPDQPGAHPHLMVSGGKNNTVYLVDRDAMGGFNSSNDSQIVQSLVDIFPFGSPEPGNYSAPVYFNGTIYFGPIRDNIQSFRLTNGLLSTSPASVTTDIFNYPGATLAISANGSSDGILWAIQRNGDCGVLLTCGSAAPGVLKAFDATNLGRMLYSSDQMPTRDAFDFATKFSVPLVANGKVFVASMGRLTVYGLLP